MSGVYKAISKTRADNVKDELAKDAILNDKSIVEIDVNLKELDTDLKTYEVSQIDGEVNKEVLLAYETVAALKDFDISSNINDFVPLISLKLPDLKPELFVTNGNIYEKPNSEMFSTEVLQINSTEYSRLVLTTAISIVKKANLDYGIYNSIKTEPGNVEHVKRNVEHVKRNVESMTISEYAIFLENHNMRLKPNVRTALENATNIEKGANIDGIKNDVTKILSSTLKVMLNEILYNFSVNNAITKLNLYRELNERYRLMGVTLIEPQGGEATELLKRQNPQLVMNYFAFGKIREPVELIIKMLIKTMVTKTSINANPSAKIVSLYKANIESSITRTDTVRDVLDATETLSYETVAKFVMASCMEQMVLDVKYDLANVKLSVSHFVQALMIYQYVPSIMLTPQCWAETVAIVGSVILEEPSYIRLIPHTHRTIGRLLRYITEAKVNYEYSSIVNLTLYTHGRFLLPLNMVNGTTDNINYPTNNLKNYINVNGQQINRNSLMSLSRLPDMPYDLTDLIHFVTSSFPAEVLDRVTYDTFISMHTISAAQIFSLVVSNMRTSTQFVPSRMIYTYDKIVSQLLILMRRINVFGLPKMYLTAFQRLNMLRQNIDVIGKLMDEQSNVIIKTIMETFSGIYNSAQLYSALIEYGDAINIRDPIDDLLNSVSILIYYKPSWFGVTDEIYFGETILERTHYTCTFIILSLPSYIIPTSLLATMGVILL